MRRVKKRREEERRSQKRKSQKKEDPGARKGRKVAKQCVFQWFVALEGRKVGSLKLARWKMKNCTLLWREAHLQVKKLKTPQCRTTFGNSDVEKVHAVVARSTFASQNVQNTSVSDHFWKFRCRKSARRCGAKHILKSKCTKHTMVGPLLEVAMSKKCTPLWREAHFEVKMCKTHHGQTTFGSWDVEKVHAVEARSTSRSQNVKNTRGSDHFWTFRCRFAWQAQGIVHLVKSEQKSLGFVAFSTTTTTKPHYIPIHYTTTTNYTFTTFHYLHNTLHYTPLHSTTLHYIPLHYITLHYTALHYTPLHYTTLHLTTLHSTPIQYTTLNHTTLHYTTPRDTTLHYTTLITLNYAALDYTTPHSTTLHYTSLHYTPLQYSTLHSITLHYTTPRDTTQHNTTRHNATQHNTTLHYTTLYTTLHCTALHYTALH